MTARQPISLGHSLGALKSLDRLLATNPKVLDKLGSTRADRDYLTTGLAAAIRQLEFVRDNEAAIRAALNAVKARRAEGAQRRDAEGAQRHGAEGAQPERAP